MIRAHRNAVLALLSGIPNLTLYDGIVPNVPALPYAVLWASAPLRWSDRMCGTQENARELFSTTAVGATADQVGWVQEKVHAALVDVLAVISGRSCERIKHAESAATDIDYDVDPPVLTAVDSWLFVSIPA